MARPMIRPTEVGGNTTHDRADFEDEDGTKMNPFNGVEGVELAEDELDRAGRQKVAGAIPANVVDGFKLISDARYGGGDDGVVLSSLTLAFSSYARVRINEETSPGQRRKQTRLEQW